MSGQTKSANRMCATSAPYSCWQLRLIVVLLAVCHPKVTDAQFYPQQRIPRQGSVSRASSNARERQVDLGLLGFTQGVSNSRAVTKQNGGQRNGGLTSVARSNAVTRELNLGPLDIGSTLTRTQTRNNGAVSRGIAHDLNIGPVGIGTSLSPSNLRNGLGLQRGPDGGVSLGLGLLNVGLTPNAQQNNALTQAQVNAAGQNARARSNSNSFTQSQQFGGIGITDTQSRSNAFGRTKFGSTSALTGGVGGGAATNALTGGRAYRGVRSAPVQRQLRRPKRRAQFIPFAYPDNYYEAPRRQRQFNRQPGGGGFYFPDQIQNANSQGVANNKGNRFGQQAGANTHSNNRVTDGGLFQDNGGSSIGSNLANDGSSGQVSSANVAQLNSQTAGGQMSSNNAQSQALNFDPNQQQAASANAGTKHDMDENSERIESNSGAQSTNNNQFGTATNIANTNSAVFNEGNQQGSTSDASSQSLFQGASGQNAGANTNANTNSMRGPNGFVSNSASSSASANSQGGNDANANASASSSSASGGRGGSSSFTDASAGAGAGGGDGSGGAQANSAANAQKRPGRKRRYAPCNNAPTPPPQVRCRNCSDATAAFQQPQTVQTTRIQQQRQQKQQQQQQQQQQQRQQQIASELADLRRMRYNNRAPPPPQQLPPPHNGQYAPGRYPAGRYAPATAAATTTASDGINKTTEQFDVIDVNQRQARTFDVFTNFINSLTGCVYPCTVEAYQQNRCCLVSPLPPVTCCQVQPYPQPPYRPPPPPPPPPQRPPITCCSTCGYGYYGPPPCPGGNGGYYYGAGGGGGNPLLSAGGNLLGNGGQVAIYLPPPIFG